MNLSKLKQKYKQILQQAQEQKQSESEQQWQAYSRMKQNRRKHILTQSNYVNNSSIIKNQLKCNEEKYVKVREKLAQCLVNIGRKDQEIGEYKLRNVRLEENVKMLEDQIAEYKDTISSLQSQIVQQKVQQTCFQKTLAQINKSIQSQKLDKELLQRQIQHYQQQIQSYRKQSENKDGKMEEMKKEIKNVEKYKAANARLREDVARLTELLAETEKYRVFASKIEYKNYIGRVCKEQECWISQDLVQDVEGFLRKQQVGHNNKEFTNNLIKFISKNIESTKQHIEKKAKKFYNSKLKDNQRRQNHSMNLMQIREQQLKKSLLGNSMIKSRRNTHTLNDSKIFTESFIYGGLDKSHVTHNANLNMNRNRDVCLEILGSFRKGIVEMIEGREIKRKKLIKLVDWLIEGIMAIFPRDRNGGYLANAADFRLETEEIKISV